jgi:site-specific recombinase XerD
MQEDSLIAFMKQANKPSGTINSYLNSVRMFENFLQTHRKGVQLEKTNPGDLRAFVDWAAANNENAYRHLWGIKTYYEYKRLTDMGKSSQELMEFIQNETRKLSEFLKVDKGSVKKLSAIGISTVNQLLRKGSTLEERQELAKSSGAPVDSISELFKLSQLSRLPGLKKVRGRLFYEAGLDSLDSIAALNAEEIHSQLQDYIDRTGFDGIAPTVGEAEVAVTMAQFLPKDLI